MNQIDQGCGGGGPLWRQDEGLSWAVDVGRKHLGLGLEGFEFTDPLPDLPGSTDLLDPPDLPDPPNPLSTGPFDAT